MTTSNRPIRLLFAAILLWPLCQNPAHADPVLDAVKGIEQELEARVGFFMHDLETGEALDYRADHRFPLNSVFKLFACGALLAQVDNGESTLGDAVDVRDYPVVPWSPAVKESIGAGRFDVTLGAACGMMLSVSDNTAANIVLAEIGGPEGFTVFMRSIGDDVTRLDRWETELNEGLPGDPRDTTTPRAIGDSLRKLLLGDVLSPPSRTMLREWLSRHSVADDLFRAALPPAWSIDDRTGAGGHGSRAIVAIMYPPNREPVIAALFMRDTRADLARRNKAAARVGAEIVMRVETD
ncbi:MAG: class A beta-lactamase [Woeseiaceae bacterium]|nr:class A beta-lactamase [Woeseiaceae bacterium]